MESRSGASLSLFGRDGCRKYLTPTERDRFIATALRCARPEVGTLCLTLAYSGCRISEALALTSSAVERDEGFIAIRSLKKRGLLVIRQVPVPDELIDRLAAVHHLSERPPQRHLWSLSRSRAWQLVKAVMAQAEIGLGPHATPKGLRHAFGVHAIRSGVPLNLLQRWLGHASMSTTAIYADAMGREEREIAARMWGPSEAVVTIGSIGSRAVPFSSPVR